MEPESISSAEWALLENCINRYESAWGPNSIDRVGQFLPENDDSENLPLLVELIRVDMELAWESGLPRPLEDYLVRIPHLQSEAAALRQIGFEAYRQAIRYPTQSDDLMRRPETYAEKYGIDVSRWPVWNASEPRSAHRARSGASSPANAVSFPKVGDRFCDFDLIGELGAGACGRVFLARQNDLAGRFVCLKVTTQTSRESQHLARLQHGNIVPIYSVHQQKGLTAVCMPFLGVSTVKDLLSVYRRVHSHSDSAPRSGQALVSTTNFRRAQSVLETIADDEVRQGFERILHVQSDLDREHPQGRESGQENDWISLATVLCQGAAEGLVHAHEKGLIHGDVKPANILVSDDGQPILLDFHLASAAGGSGDRWLGGTLPYMAPEQMQSFETEGPADLRSDIYSLGVVLFQMVTGKLPYPVESGKSLKQTLSSQIEHRRQPPAATARELNAKVSHGLSAIIDKCLKPNPADRYPSAAELVTDLQREQSHLPLKFAENRSLKERVQKFAKRHPKLTSASAVLAGSLFLVSVMTWALWHRSNRIAELSASAASQELIKELGEAQVAMSVITNDFQRLRDRANDAYSVLNRFNASSIDEWKEANRSGYLTGVELHRERHHIGETFFWLAESFRRQARLTHHDQEKRELLQKAVEMNSRALEFLEDESQIGLGLQRRLLENPSMAWGEMETTGMKLATDPATTSAVDGVMVAFLNQYASGATNWASQLTQIDGDNPIAWIVAGNILANHGYYERAANHYQVAISQAPFRAGTHWLLGRAQQDLGRYEESLESFSRVLELDPTDLRCHLNIGWLYLAMGNPAEAENRFSKAIAAGTYDSRAWYLRSQARRQLGREKLADEDLQTFMEREPYDEIGYVERGAISVDIDPQAAIGDFQFALQCNPRSTMALQNLAHVYSEVLGDIPKAIEFMDRLVEVDPNQPRHRATRGVLHARAGNRENAHRDARAALAMGEDAKTAYICAGIFALTGQIEKDDYSEAVRLVREAAFRNPGLVHRYLGTDPDIDPLRDLPAFQDLVESIARLAETGR